MAISPIYALRETGQNLWRNAMLSFATIITIGISLWLFGGFFLFNYAVDNATARWRAVSSSWCGWTRRPPSNRTRTSAPASTRARPSRAGPTSIRTRPYEEFKDIFADTPELVEVVTADVMPPSYRIVPENPDADVVEELAAQFEERPGVRDVVSADKTIRDIQRQADRISQVFLVGSIILLSAATLLILTNVVSAIRSRGAEIEIMKVVGATNWFIRVPFMLEGLVQAVLGALGAWVGLWFLNNQTIEGLSDPRQPPADAGLQGRRRRVPQHQPPGARDCGDRLGDRLDGRRHPLPRRLIVHLSMTLPTMRSGLDRGLTDAWCAAVDEGPYRTLGVGERIAFDNLEMHTALTYAAARTERVRLASTIWILPMHPVAVVAKQVATLDVLSAGRFDLGVGVGGRDQDYQCAERPFTARHQTLDEQVAELRRLWAGGDPGVGPTPVQPGGPMVFASAMGPKSTARAAQWADGNMGFTLSPDTDDHEAAFGAIRAAWAEAGRDRPWISTSFFYSVERDAEEVLRDYAFRYLRHLRRRHRRDDGGHVLGGRPGHGRGRARPPRRGRVRRGLPRTDNARSLPSRRHRRPGAGNSERSLTSGQTSPRSAPWPSISPSAPSSRRSATACGPSSTRS